MKLLDLLGYYLLILAAAMEITWVWFSAVMRWREIHDAGLLDAKHLAVRWAIYFNLAIGYLLDAALNFIFSLVLLEPVRYDLRIGNKSKWYEREVLFTDRLIRWHHSSDTDWWTVHVRKKLVAFGQQMLDIVDTDGIHIK